MGGKKKQTVGYRYFTGMHLSLCHGPIDKITKIKYGDKVAWQGESAGGQINIDAYELHGGDSGEGGIQGRVDVLMGEPTQARNDYLLRILGNTISAYRGVVSLVCRQLYWGTSPYIKPLSITAQRIFKAQDGAQQWYPEKAAIGAFYSSTGQTSVGIAWEYLTQPLSGTGDYSGVGVDTSGWSLGYLPIGDQYNASANAAGFRGTPAIVTPLDTKTWARGYIYVSEAQTVNLTGWMDNGLTVWVNGVQEYDNYNANGVPISFSVDLQAGLNLIVIRLIDDATTWGGDRAFIDLKWSLTAKTQDMNPAHIIRECISNSDGGMGYADADIDAASFTAAADALHAEGFGLSFLWEQDGQIEEFVRDVQTHIDARVYVHPHTGKWTLKLIRADYDAETLPVLGPDQIRYVEDYARPQFGELSNSVSVKYWDAATQQEASLSVDDPAMIQMQGAVIPASYDYPGVTNADLAARLARRDLRAVSSQLLSATIYCNRAAASLLPGDPFKFDWPQLHAEPIICRVGKIELGSPEKGEVKITLVEDVFGLASSGIVRDDGGGWDDPAAVQIGASTALLLEAPYYELVQRYGESRTNSLLTETPEAGMLLLTGTRPAGAVNAIGYVAGDEMREMVDFSPSGSLAVACSYDDLVISIAWAGDVPPATGSHIQVGDECMRFDGLDSNGRSLVGRGVLDTVPAAHAYGAACWGWDAFAVTDEVERAEGENVSAQIVPRGTSSVGPFSTAVDIDFAARAIRPYPPGKLRINAAAYPEAFVGELTTSWAHRDRLLQTAALVDTEQASIGPEPGTTYTLRIYGDDVVSPRVYSGLTGVDKLYPQADELVDNGGSSGLDPSWAGVNLLMNFNGADGAATFTDSSSFARTVTRQGGAALSTASYAFGGASLYLDGAGDYLEATIPAPGTSALTIEAWVKVTGRGGVAGWSVVSNYNNRALLYIEAGGLPAFGMENAGVSRFITASASIFDGQWHYLAGVRDGAACRLYVDGILAASSTGTTVNITGNAVKIGHIYSAAVDRHLAGYVDDVRITVGTARYSGATHQVPTQQLGQYTYYGIGFTRFRVELESVRSGWVSWQKHDYAFERAGYGYNYGKFYGGV